MKKVILITNIITPYRTPLYNYISQNNDFEFKVIALAEREKNRKWELQKDNIKFGYQVLSGWHLFFRKKTREISIHINRGVFKVLWKYKPGIIITSGYDSLAYWQAFLYCKLFKKKYILWNGTTLLSTDKTKGIRGLLKKIIIKGTNKYIAYGTKAKEYLEYFGAEPKKIYISTNTIDVGYFYDKGLQYRNSREFLEERKKYPKILFLYVGQLIKRKGIDQILKALKLLNDSQIGFIIVGSGPEERNLKEFCAKNKLKNIFFKGFQQQNNLPQYYALADVFILPSFQEVWGLVINEALASGLYVLSSKYTGVSYDLINEENGKVFDPNNISEIVEQIKFCKNNLEKIRKKKMKIAGWAKENLIIEKSGEQFISAIKSL
ncbi:MAG: glycosyltransferase family 4 protein [Candidatus Nealsonbacteria bacterium]